LKLQLPTDETGRFIEWLHKIEPVYGFILKEIVWDIGTIEAYEEINDVFSTHKALLQDGW
jgi:NDP-sugar pyrophosphorylase family protein